jgi:sugar phosphate permease
VISALVMFVFGFAPWATSSVTIMFILLFINGWAQGMGWPPSGRTMVHWWSQKERGGVVSVWNVAHNVGGGLISRVVLAASEGVSDRPMTPEAVAAHWDDIMNQPVVEVPTGRPFGTKMMQGYRPD